jgi:hypothetical protein
MAFKLLAKYRKAKEGEIVMTKHGRARIVRILLYRDVIEEMNRGGASLEEIKLFDMRVNHFLGSKSRYFECELIYSDRGVERIDWSEYLSIKNERTG